MLVQTSDLYHWLRSAEQQGCLFVLVMQDIASGEGYPVYLRCGEDFPALRPGPQRFIESFDVSRWILRGRP